MIYCIFSRIYLYTNAKELLPYDIYPIYIIPFKIVKSLT